MQTLKIFLADDHSMIREGLKSLVNAQADMTVVGEASDGDNAFRQVRDLNPDVVLMDVSMPQMPGARATARIRRECPGVKILALTVHEDRSYLRELLEAGASGYLLKRAAATELIRAIHVVAEGGVYLDPSMAGKMVDSFVGGDGTETYERALSEREADVLRLIAQGYSNKEIAAQLAVSIKTVETYKARAMDKLGLNSRVDIVRYAMDHGWLENS